MGKFASVLIWVRHRVGSHHRDHEKRSGPYFLGLMTTCTSLRLSLEISKKNTAPLQYLAHFIADHLVNIAEHMQENRDRAPDALKRSMDKLEASDYLILF